MKKKKKSFYNVGVLCAILALILCILSLIYYAFTKRMPNVTFTVVILLGIGVICTILEGKKK